MGFQVNGTTVIDGSRNFSASSFGTTVNGSNLVGTDEIKYVRPGVSSLHVVGDYILCAHEDMQSLANNILPVNRFNGGTTHAGSGFKYSARVVTSSTKGVRAFYRFRTSVTSFGLSGTWRCTTQGTFTQDHLNWFLHQVFFARIS